MDRNWNRNGGGGGNSGGGNSGGGNSGGGNSGGEKMYRQPYSNANGGHHQGNHYRKKNDYSGQDFYSKNAKPTVQPVKKESLQVASVEDELMATTFSWIKNSSVN
jgi:hypothetical protein